MVSHPDGGFVLVRHTYQKGSYLPGGAIGHGETPQSAVVRELREEIGLRDFQALELFGTYTSLKEYKRDTIYLFRVIGAEISLSTSPEIAEVCRYEIDNLPQDVSPATRKRLLEMFQGRERDAEW